jgi:hypothetical protein
MAEPFTEVSNIGIEVKVNVEDGIQTTVETRLYCKIANCLEDVDLYSDDSHSVHEAICPVHGRVGSFPTYAAFSEFTKFVANGILEAGGYALLTGRTRYVHVDEQPE